MKIFRGEQLTFMHSAAPYDRHMEGSAASSVLYIRQGRLKLAVRRPLGGDFALCTYGPGTILEYRAWAGFPGFSGMYAEACENTAAWAFSREVFSEILSRNGEFLELYRDFCSAAQLLFMKRMELTACLDADQRVAGWLAELCRMAGAQEEDGCSIPCRLTQQEIADYLLIHVTTFNRMFSELKKQGIVERRKSSIFIPDQERLRQYCEGLYL